MTETSLFHVKVGKEFEVKELFKEISALIKTHYGGKTDKLDVLDAGCASGELPYFLKEDLGTSGTVWGFDVAQTLVNNAMERFGDSGIKFFVRDAWEFKLDRTFDVVTMTSLISYFDDPYPILRAALTHLKSGGLLIISGIFNPWNIDVRLRYKLESDKEWDEIHAMNQFSVNNLRKFFDDLGFEATFSKQVMPFDMEPKENPIRSWTVNADESRRMTNGLQLLYDIQILRVTKK